MSVAKDLKRIITQPLIEWKLMINYENQKEKIKEIKDAVVSTDYKKTYVDLEYVTSDIESADYPRDSFELLIGIHDLKNDMWHWFNKGTYKVTEDSVKINPDTNTIKVRGVKDESVDAKYFMLDQDYINNTYTSETDDNSDSIVTKICPFADKCKLLVYKNKTYEILSSKTDIVKGITKFAVEKVHNDCNVIDTDSVCKMLGDIVVRASVLDLAYAKEA